MCEARVKFFRQLLVIPATISIAVPVAAQINFEIENSKTKQHQLAQGISSDGYLISDSNPQNIQEDSDSLQITVTGTRNEKYVDDVPASIDVIDLSDKKYSGFSELKDFFRYEPGVSVEVDSYVPYGTAASTEGNVNIRGMELNRILFIQDGIRLPAAFGDTLSYNYDRGDYIDFNTLKAVEVFKGPGSTLFGSDALGGIISFRSLEASDLLNTGEDFAFEIPANYTSFNAGKSGALKIATRDEDTGFSAIGVLSYLDSDERKPKDFTDRENWINDVDRTGSSYYLNVKKETGENKNIGLSIERVNRDTETSRPTNNLNRGYYTYTKMDQDVEVKKDRLILSYNFKNEDKDQGVNSIVAKGYYQNAETDDVWDDAYLSRGTPYLRVSDYQLKDESYGVDFQMGSKINQHNLTYGLTSSNTSNEYLQERWLTNSRTNLRTTDHKKRYPDADTKRLGVFVQDELRLGKVDVVAGLRYEKTKVDVESDSLHTNYCTNGGTLVCELGELDVDSLTPKIGAIYDISPNVSVYGQYAMGFKTPTWSEMNAIQVNLNYGYLVRPNPNLKPEKSNSYEIGLRSKTDRNQFRIATFYNSYTDFIGTSAAKLETVNGRPNIAITTPENNEEAFIWGIELNNDYTLTDNDSGKISLINSVSFLEGENEETDQPLQGIDPFKLVTGLRYEDSNERFNTELIATYLGEATLPDSDTYFNPEATTIFDLIGSYKVNNDLTVDLGVYNLADKRHYKYQNTRAVSKTASGIERYSEPGRSLKAGFNFKF